MKNQRLYQQNNQENIITCITTQFENYLSYSYIYCMNIINAVAMSTKDKMSLRGGLRFGVFFSLWESIDNDLIIADYLYFIFDLLTNLVGRRIRPSISLCSWPGKYPWTLHPPLPDLWTLVLALSILILPYCYLDSASEKTDNNAQLKTWWLFFREIWNRINNDVKLINTCTTITPVLITINSVKQWPKIIEDSKQLWHI